MNLKDNVLTTKNYGRVYCEEYVKETVIDFIFILDTQNNIDSNNPYDTNKLRHICKKYDLDLFKIINGHYSTQELVFAIYGDFEE